MIKIYLLNMVIILENVLLINNNNILERMKSNEKNVCTIYKFSAYY